MRYLRVVAAKCVVMLLFASTLAFSGENKNLSLIFLDVGEGDSTLIKAPCGATALVDAGNLITGAKVTKYLKSAGVKKIDHLIFTHPHMDHTGGSFSVAQNFEIGKVYDNGDILTSMGYSSDYIRWYLDLIRARENYSVLKAGASIDMCGVTLNVLWPPVSGPPINGFKGNVNDNSLVIKLEYGGFSALLTGDLSTKGELALLKLGVDVKADVLKAGHHGAIDASGERFILAVEPKISVISVNKENIRGYPSGKVIERLKRIGSKVYRTDFHGDITIEVQADGSHEVLTGGE